ncbi:cation transporter [Sporolactobacillus sp. STSJ-5]|uniref:cation transporter n=1 Tax=Sporolactobacillus sp. STSJ-5 TaxID=2965076 RepID=UPI0021044B9F|nr:cation transporter [Sporolactobacillus sp. STSJ-5]MCQ2011361.1 cation transporter [Sporolactobacillus sp. STSJ-5]
MNTKAKEQKALIVGAITYSIMGLSSLAVYYMTKIEAMFLDASFVLLTVVSTICATLISKYSVKKSDRFPLGLFVLEPIYALIRSLLILSLTVFACINVSQSAWNYFIYGKGKVINVLPIIPYEILAVVLCGFLYFFYMRKNRQLNNVSTMLSAESKTTLLDGTMCAGIGLLAVLLSFIDKNSPLSFLLYTGDFFITITLSLAVVKAPFKVLKLSFIEIANGTIADQALKNKIERTIQTYLPQEVSKDTRCLIFKVGMSFRVRIAVNAQNMEIDRQVLLQSAKRIQQILSEEYGHADVQLIDP